ncbi:MAG: GNAT family N-acetyltransferase [Bacteroidetes bacterium]|nr:GNAT family N-acetyltransferase [Bacteroidota bacterium]
MKFLIRSISAADTRPLRQQLLRPDQHTDELVYEGDDANDTLHAGAFLKGQLVGIASVFRQPRPGDRAPLNPPGSEKPRVLGGETERRKTKRFTDSPIHPFTHSGGFRGAWRLRGMATIPEVQNQGCGSALLSECIKHVKKNGGAEFWCNARIGAVKFYEAHGFVCIGDVFEIAGIGQHFVMVKDVTQLSS